MRRWLVRIVMVAVLAGAAWAAQVTLFASQPIEVQVTRPSRGAVESTITNSKAGTIQARRRADLSPEIGGRVVELSARAGAKVKRGDVLMRLDDHSYRAQLEKSARDVATAEARHREVCLSANLAESEYARHQALAERRIVSQNLLDQLRNRSEVAQASCESADAAIASARAGVGVLETEMRKTVLRAPFDGVIAELTIELGEYTTPSPPGLPIPPVMEIIDTTSIFVSAPMDEVDSARVHAGQPVRVTIDPYPGRSFAGTVSRVAPYVLDIEAQNRTVEIEVDLEDHAFASLLLPGTSADVEVILDIRANALRVPTATLLEGQAVLVVNADQVLERRTVEVGLRNWDFTEIRSGLDEGDRVVTTLDRVEIQPGARVVAAGEPADG